MSVVEIPKSGELLLFDRTRRKRSGKQWSCDHAKVSLDEESRLVECRDCGHIEDGFSYLWRLAVKADRLGEWLKRYTETQRLRDRAMTEDRNGNKKARFYTTRPADTAKKSRAVWDRIVDETGEPPEGLHRNLSQVIARDDNRAIYFDAGVEAGWRLYSIDEWIELKRLRKLVVVEDRVWEELG